MTDIANELRERIKEAGRYYKQQPGESIMDAIMNGLRAAKADLQAQGELHELHMNPETWKAIKEEEG